MPEHASPATDLGYRSALTTAESSSGRRTVPVAACTSIFPVRADSEPRFKKDTGVEAATHRCCESGSPSVPSEIEQELALVHAVVPRFFSKARWPFLWPLLLRVDAVEIFTTTTRLCR